MPHVDILEQPEPLRKPLLGSLGLHVAVFGVLALSALVGGRTSETWGDLNSGGPGSIAVNVVKPGATPVAKRNRQSPG